MGICVTDRQESKSSKKKNEQDLKVTDSLEILLSYLVAYIVFFGANLKWRVI